MSSSPAVVEVATAAVPMVVAESVLVATTGVTVVEMFAAAPIVVTAVAVAAADLLEVKMVADPMMLLACYRPALVISSCYFRLLTPQCASLSIVPHRADYKRKSHQESVTLVIFL